MDFQHHGLGQGLAGPGGRTIWLGIQSRDVCGDKIVNFIDEDPHLFEQSPSVILVLTLPEIHRERLELLNYLLKQSIAIHIEI